MACSTSRCMIGLWRATEAAFGAEHLVDRQRSRAGRGVGYLAGVDRQRLGLELAVVHGVSRRRVAATRLSVPSGAGARRRGGCSCSWSARRDHAGVDAGPVQPAEEPRVLDLDAAVHHASRPASRASASASALTTPICCHRHLAPIAIALARDRQHVLAAAEHVDHVDRLRIGQRRIAALAEHLVVARVHRHDAVAVLLQVLGGEIARPMPLADRPTTAIVRVSRRMRRSVVMSSVMEGPGMAGRGDPAPRRESAYPGRYPRCDGVP